jgi:O-antigen/teichoic acid export membrane protein
MSTSLKKNFAYKGLLTIATPIIGMITFPYISRILGVSNIGLVNFVDNTINYFLLFATMGIGSLGVRSIAASRGSQDELNKTFSNLLGLNLLFTLVTLLVYTILVTIIPKFNVNSELFYIGTAKILFTSLLIEWFFNGIENFRYITLRSLLIRLLYIGSVFAFIRDSDDYKLYFILTTALIVINTIINIIYAKRYVKIIPSELISCRFLKENLTLGVYALMTSMYLTFNVMYLGLVSNNTEVGYYTSAFKLYHLILSIFTAFTSVMLPRMSSLLSQGETKKFREYINHSMEFISLFSIPLIVCCSIMAPEIIYLLCGKGYEGAIVPMQIIMPAILFVGIAQVLAIQVLMPLKEDKILLLASFLGAFVSLMINILLVDKIQSVGSAFVLLCSEFVVTVTYIIYTGRKGIICLNYKPLAISALKTIPCAAICIICHKVLPNQCFSLLVSCISSIFIYILMNMNEVRRIMNKLST